MALILAFGFDNEEEALKFAEQHESRLFGVYKRPTMFCSNDHGGRKTEVAYTMGTRFGWWVCAKCKKPSRTYWQNVLSRKRDLMHTTTFGVNLYSQYFDGADDEDNNQAV